MLRFIGFEHSPVNPRQRLPRQTRSGCRVNSIERGHALKVAPTGFCIQPLAIRLDSAAPFDWVVTSQVMIRRPTLRRLSSPRKTEAIKVACMKNAILPWVARGAPHRSPIIGNGFSSCRTGYVGIWSSAAGAVGHHRDRLHLGNDDRQPGGQRCDHKGHQGCQAFQPGQFDDAVCQRM